MKFFKNTAITLVLVGAVLSPISVYSSQPSAELHDSGLNVVSVNENINVLPGAMSRSSITFDHNAGVGHDGPRNREWVWGNTQASQNNIRLDSYTRALYRPIGGLGSDVADSERRWSTNQGRSHATSGEIFIRDAFSLLVARTFYGI